MANPRQRRKKASHTYRPVSMRHTKQRLKKMPAIRGPKVLQQAWDNSKTVKQNYASLGLAHGLNPVPSGGVEFHEVQHMESSSTSESPKSPVGGHVNHAQSIPKGYGRIIRDQDGNVVQVEFAQGEEAADESTAPTEGIMESLEPQIPSSILDKWAGQRDDGPSSLASRDVVKALEMISSMPSDGSKSTISASITGVGSRHSSTGEKMYLQRLVDKYGVNIADMSRDRKLNPEQRTEGELRRALRRGGFV